MTPSPDQLTMPWDGIASVNQIPATTDKNALKALGFIRAKNVIPISLNNQIKAEARRLGVNADRLLGLRVCQASGDVRRAAARAERARLESELGPDWRNLLMEGE